ncbi:MAG: sulfatase-like hydrolase/transferase [Planctomycetota bacterium]|nr:sulfatase-like hydrolase/transferase [Planctomycetota bacterium]
MTNAEPGRPIPGPSPVRRGFAALLESRMGGLAAFGALALIFSLIVRIALTIYSFATYSRADMAGEGWYIPAAFAIGLFYDLVTVVCLSAPTALLLLILPDRLFAWRPMRAAAWTAFGAMVFLLLFTAAAEWFFWDEFDCRFNFIAVDYFDNPKEVIENILESYPVVPILAGLAAAATGLTLLGRRFAGRSLRRRIPFRARLIPAGVFIVPAVLSVLFVGPNLSYISGNRYINELGKNGFFSMADAALHLVLDYEEYYVSRDRGRVLTNLRPLLKTSRSQFVSSDPGNITRRVVNPGPTREANVVIVLVESLSGEFMGYTGGTLTPKLDALAEKGLLFTQAYATGTRTVRGMEAVLLSLPPTPGKSVVKRPDQKPLFSLPKLFSDRGYDTAFLYGGYGLFDNMNAFMHACGCRAVDRGDFKKDERTFGNAWGLCDQDLFHRALKEGDRQHKPNRKFFQFILTTSNHRPFTFPAVEGIQSNGRRDAAVRYTDYAIDEFLRQASAKPWFDNTIFVIVADHCHNSRGKQDLPISCYRIPILMYAPKLIAPGRFEGLCSQMDLAPTLLGLMNVSYVSRFFGVDVLTDPPERAIVGRDQPFGLYKKSMLTVVSPVKKLAAFAITHNPNPAAKDPHGDLLQTPAPPKDELVLDTLSYIQGAAALLPTGSLSPCDTILPPTSTTAPTTAPAP